MSINKYWAWQPHRCGRHDVWMNGENHWRRTWITAIWPVRVPTRHRCNTARLNAIRADRQNPYIVVSSEVGQSYAACCNVELTASTGTMRFYGSPISPLALDLRDRMGTRQGSVFGSRALPASGPGTGGINRDDRDFCAAPSPSRFGDSGHT